MLISRGLGTTYFNLSPQGDENMIATTLSML